VWKTGVDGLGGNTEIISKTVWKTDMDELGGNTEIMWKA
jgi:hypothetical protein